MSALLLLLLTQSAYAEDINVTVQPVRNTKGQVIYSLYDSASGYDNEHEVKSGKVAPVQGTVKFTISDVPPGTYALSVIHDENSNGKLDTNFLGQPKEMFGLSNITDTLWSRPSFDRLKFNVKAGAPIEIPILLKWQ